MIDINKKYKTRAGNPVRIYATDGNSWDPVHGAVKDREGWKIKSWKESGAFLYGEISDNDLMEVGPYDDLKIDDKVMVKDDSDAMWKKRHFAGIGADGKPLVFRSGGTSWSNSLCPAAYDMCKPYQDNEDEQS